MRRLIGMLFAAAALAGCASGPTLGERMGGLMGDTQLQVVRALGVPDGSVEADGVRLLRWSSASASVYPVGPPWFGPGRLRPAPMIVRRRCDLEIEFERTGRSWRATTWRTRGSGC